MYLVRTICIPFASNYYIVIIVQLLGFLLPNLKALSVAGVAMIVSIFYVISLIIY